MLYAIIALTTCWLIAAHKWNAYTFGIVAANDGMLKTLCAFQLLVANEAECFYFNKQDTLALRDI
jgi:hypothetical protein